MPADFKALQQAFAAHIRDPQAAPPPAGADPERMRQYAQLFFNNVDGMLNTSMVRLRGSLDDSLWQRLTRQFFRDCRQESPFVVDMPARFLEFLGAIDAPLSDWQQSLAELDLATYLCRVTDENPELPAELDPAGDPLAGHPVCNPEGRLFASPYPVHRTDELEAGTEPEPAATFLFLLRNAEGQVTLHQLSPASARLLEMLDEHPDLSGAALLDRLAGEFGVPAEQLTAFGAQQFCQWQAEGVVVGTMAATNTAV